MADLRADVGEAGDMTAVRAVTMNLGCASPSAELSERRTAALNWTAYLFASDEAPDLVFAQETPVTEEWHELWRDAGYTWAASAGPTYNVRSGLLWRTDMITGTVLDIPTAGYHGSYVAGALLEFPGSDSPMPVLSVHASPSVVDQRYLDTWEECAVEYPAPRTGGGPNDGRLYDSDMVLETLRKLVANDELLAAGDLNECLLWDDDHGESWGWQFFGKGGRHGGRVQAAGLQSVLHQIWPEEVQTRFEDGSRPYQLDHVLSTPRVARWITDAQVQTWEDLLARGWRSDHRPIAFTLDPA